MTEATAEQPAFELPQTREGQIALLSDLAAENRAVFEQAVRIASGPMTADDRTVVLMLARRAADIEGVELAILDLLNQEVRLRTVEEVMARADRAMMAAVPDPEPAPRHRRHRAPRAQRPLYPRSLKGFVPLGAAVTAARHSWPAAHPVVAGTIATAAVGIAATTAAVVPGGAATFGFGSPAGTPAPAASIWSAVPVTSPSSIASAVTHPRGKGGAGSPRTLTVLAPPSLPAYVPPAPGGGQDPASQPAPVQGTLSVSVNTLDLGPGGGTAAVTLTASGGPVDWHLVVPDGLSASSMQGHLDDGGSADITVATIVAEVLDGDATLSIWPGGVHVAVKWEAPLPVTLPTDAPADLPSVVPTVSVP